MVDRINTAVIQAGDAVEPSPAHVRKSGFTLEVIEGPMDGVLVAEDRDEIFIGRRQENVGLSLHADMLVSSRHAVLRRTEDPAVLSLQDLDSANGTWVAGSRLVTPHRIPLGTCFVVGQSVLRCSARDERSTALIEPRELADERRRLIDRSAPEMDHGYGAAAMLACRERRGFVNDRHLFLGLAMTAADLPILERGHGPIPFDFLNEMLWRSADWSGIEDWVDQHLKQIKITNFFAVSLPFSPRVIRSLQQAERLVEDRGREYIEPIDWFRAAFDDGASRTSQVLARHRLNPHDMADDLARTVAKLSPRKHTGQTVEHRGTDSVAGAGRKFRPAPSALVLSTGDPALDSRAQELARRLYGLAALYHLATPEERRSVMQQMLGHEVGEVEIGYRRSLLEQVRRLFPIDPGSSEGASEMARLNNKIAQLEQRVAELEVDEPSHPAIGSGLPWHLLVEPGAEQRLDGLSPVDRPRVEFLLELLGFGIRVERFVIGMVHGLTVQSTTTTSMALPGYRTSIKAYLDDMTAGRQVQRQDLAGYLRDLETWLVASLTAYHEGPEIWFKALWKKISPAAIEAHTGGLGKMLGVQQWDNYKAAVRRISPEVAIQQILFEVRKIAQERHIEFNRRETKP
jgi:hypothetical protein